MDYYVGVEKKIAAILTEFFVHIVDNVSNSCQNGTDISFCYVDSYNLYFAEKRRRNIIIPNSFNWHVMQTAVRLHLMKTVIQAVSVKIRIFCFQ